MANISLYVSGQTELNDVTEFFQKRHMEEGENPIAFFDGVFYESHQERVGNIAFTDYLIYTDRAVYLWARGSSKDYLDRFNLGTVSVNSRNKDSDFATLNIKIRREEKEPIYVIFDMVEIREAELITRLHTVIETTIEDLLGVNYKKDIPPEIAGKILSSGRNVCTPQAFSISMEAPGTPTADSHIGYGQDLLEQYKASIGYNFGDQPPQGGHSEPREPRRTSQNGPAIPGPKEALKSLEALLPTDPAAIGRIASSIKDMVGDAPFKLRDQVMKDLQHVPGDVATVLTALNELIINIADNPQAERFVMNAIKTAVRNDGMIGSLGKILKLTGIGGGGARKQPQRPQSGEGSGSGKQQQHSAEDSQDDSTIRRKKINVTGDSVPDTFDPFPDDVRQATPKKQAEGRSRPAADFSDEPGDGIRRKKIAIKTDENDSGNIVAQKLMSYDETPQEPSRQDAPQAAVSMDDDEMPVVRRKKISIKAELENDSKADIARRLMSYDEEARASEVNNEPEAFSPVDNVVEEPVVRRKKISIKTVELENEEPEISEELLHSVLNQPESDNPSAGYLSIESDNMISDPEKGAEPVYPRRGNEAEKEKPSVDGPVSKTAQEGASPDTAATRHSVNVKSTQ